MDSIKIMDILNAVTMIANNLVKAEHFLAGFNLCSLQKELLSLHAQEQEKEKANAPQENLIA